MRPETPREVVGGLLAQHADKSAVSVSADLMRLLLGQYDELSATLVLIDERHGAHCADPLPMDLCERMADALNLEAR